MSYKPKKPIKVDDFTEIVNDIIKLEEGYTYLLKVPDIQSAERLARTWNELKDRPKIRIMMVLKDIDVYRSNEKE